MILLGVDEEGQVVFTDSATRDWAGEQQRLKRAKLPELISYMFPQKNVGIRIYILAEKGIRAVIF